MTEPENPKPCECGRAAGISEPTRQHPNWLIYCNDRDNCGCSVEGRTRAQALRGWDAMVGLEETQG